MDNRSKEARSRNMSNIPSKNTKPEETVRKYLFAQGLRYRKNVSKLPGKPDIVLPKYKTVVLGTCERLEAAIKFYEKRPAQHSADDYLPNAVLA